MLSSQSNSILNQNGATESNYNNSYNFWTLTSHATPTNMWIMDNFGCISAINATFARGVRPAIVVNSTVNINRGTGTLSSPYEI